MTRVAATAMTAALLLALPPVPASAEPSVSFVITGGGWGHGLGMSQYGAKGYADKGWTATQIIQHFYRSTTVAKKTLPSSVRVGIAQNLTGTTIVPSSDVAFKVGSTTVATARAGETWRITPLPTGAYRLTKNGTVVVSSTGSTTAHLVAWWNSTGGATIKVNETGNTYRWGPLELNTVSTAAGYRIRAILRIAPFDRYLYGLGEVPSSWPVEALKAQVIAARTYAVEKIGRLGQNRTGCNCALYASTSDQAYVGYSKESGTYGARWRSAVDTTAGVLALYNGAPIQAYYSSSDGGYTESNENVWGGTPVPYLRGVRDDGDVASPHHSWRVVYSRSQLETRLAASASTDVGTLTSIETLAPYGVSGRVLAVKDATSGGVRIQGSDGTKRVSGDQLRGVLGLRSTLFRIQRIAAEPPGVTLSTSAGTYFLRAGSRVRAIGTGALASHITTNEIVSAAPDSLGGYAHEAAPFREGAIVRNPAGRLWFISDGKRRPFTDDAQRASMGYCSCLVVNVPDHVLDVVPEGATMDPAAPRPNGTMLRDTQSALYLLRDGKRYLVKPEVLGSWRLTWSYSQGASDAVLATYPDGGTLGFRDGSVLKGSGPAIHLITGGLKRQFGSWAAFSDAGFTAAAVRKVADSALSLNPAGPTIASAGAPLEGLLLRAADDTRGTVWLVRGGKRLYVHGEVLNSLAPANEVITYRADLTARVPATGVLTYREGTLLGSPSKTIYLVSDGKIRPIRSSKDFSAMKLSMDAVRWVGWLDIGLHAGGPAFGATNTAPEGALVRTSTGTVYQIDNGKRRPLYGGMNGPFAATYGFRAGEVMVMNGATAKLPQGAPLGFREGSLVKGSKPTVYLISNGQRRAFTSATTFSVLGFKWSNVRTVPDGYLSLNPTGPVL